MHIQRICECKKGLEGSASVLSVEWGEKGVGNSGIVLFICKVLIS